MVSNAHRSRNQRRQCARLIPAAHEPHELQHHDQGTGRRFSETEAVHHLAGAQPAVVFYCLLRDVGQDRVGASESHDRGFAEEDSLFEESSVPAL